MPTDLLIIIAATLIGIGIYYILIKLFEPRQRPQPIDGVYLDEYFRQQQVYLEEIVIQLTNYSTNNLFRTSTPLAYQYQRFKLIKF